MILTLLVAMDHNRLLGRGGGLPWHIREDMRRFRELTWGRVLIMGRKTWQSLPVTLHNRRLLVLSRTQPTTISGCRTYSSLEELLRTADAMTNATEPVFVAGGAEVYELLLPCCTEARLTVVGSGEPPQSGDVYFPAPGLTFHVWEVTEHEKFLDGDPVLDFLYLKRRQPLKPLLAQSCAV